MKKRSIVDTRYNAKEAVNKVNMDTLFAENTLAEKSEMSVADG